MRSRFYDLVPRVLEDDPKVAVVLADIGAGYLPRHERIFNVGIREQLMIGVTAGLALEGYRPVAHSYATFLVERPYEQVKLDLGHQGLGAARLDRRVLRRLDGRAHAPVSRGRRAGLRPPRVDDPRSRSSGRARARVQIGVAEGRPCLHPHVGGAERAACAR